MRLADRLRRARIPTDFELSERRFIDQLNYAHKRQFPYVVIVGPDELASSQYKLKNMTARTEQTMTADELVAVLSQSVRSPSPALKAVPG